MKKKVLATIISAAMTATILAGCAGAAAPAAPAADAPAATEEAAPAADEAAPAADEAAAPAAAGDLDFKIVVKSFQSSYWQAAVQGVNQAAEELGVKVECNGPNAESDIADQVNMLTNYLNGAPSGIGLCRYGVKNVLSTITSFPCLCTMSETAFISVTVRSGFAGVSI